MASLHTILNGLVYFNKEPYPTPVKRKVRIEAIIEGKHASVIDLDIEVPKSEGPKIRLTGDCDNSIKTYGSVEEGGSLHVCNLSLLFSVHCTRSNPCINCRNIRTLAH